MALPVTIPNTFANATTSIPLSQLDANFGTLANAVNGINSGAETLANLKASNATITGGIISNVTLDNVTVNVETLSNITVNDSLIVLANTASTAVRITQTGAGNAFVVEDSANPDATPFVVTAAGDVGIGTDAPGKKLDIVTNTSQDGIRITGSSNPRITIIDSTNSVQFDALATDTEVVLRTDTNHPLVLSTNGTARMTLDTSGNVGIGTSSPSSNLNVSTGSGTLTKNIVTIKGGGSSGSFSGLSVQSNTGDEIFTVNNLSYNISMGTVAGNVGIGTTSPSSKLHVVGTTLANTFRITDASNYTICMGYAGSGSVGLISTLGGTASLALGTDSTERMRIDSSGNVLVATTNAITGITGAQFTASNTNENPAFINIFRDDTTISNGQALGYLQFCGRDATSSLGTAHAYVAAFAEADHGAGDNATAITFGTTPDNSSTISERARITSGGNFLLGTTNSSVEAGPGFKYVASATEPYIGIVTNVSGNLTSYHYYNTNATNNGYRFYVGVNGTVYAISTTISAISDQRLKENIRDLDVGLDAVMALKPRKFDWKEGKGQNTKDCRGFIAQEFEEVFPDLIDEWKDPAPEGEEPYKSVRADLIPILVKAIQELKAELDTVKAQNAAFEARLAALEAK